MALEAAAVPEEPPTEGDWIVLEQKEFEGKTGFVAGNLIISPVSRLRIKDSVLIVNYSLSVGPNAILEIVNSTIKFNCSFLKDNRFEVLGHGECSIDDGDNDLSTTDDMSVITSMNDIPYNFTVFENATFNLRNSHVNKCGRYFNDPFLAEGLLIQANDVVISGALITEGYYGLILDQGERITIENMTIENCYIGMYVFGTWGSSVAHSSFNNNTAYGTQVRGFQRDLVLDSLQMSGNGVANMQMWWISGGNNQVINCTLGPVGPYGLILEEVEDTTFEDNTVTGCAIGVEVRGGITDVTDLTVTDCAQGVLVLGTSIITFLDLHLADTTISLERSSDTNITSFTAMTWTRVTANLTCDLAVPAGTTITIESSALNFEASKSGPTGLYCLRGGTLEIANSTVDSQSAHSLVTHLADGSRSTFFQTTFSHLGSSGGSAHRLGMYVAGTGTLEEVTLIDSLVGLVVGKSQANILNLTIRDCLTGILADGDLGRGGASIRGLDLSECTVAIRAVNDGSVSVIDARIDLAGEGFNITTASVELKDSWISDPGTGLSTAYLRQTATLDFINSVTSRDFDIGPVENAVNIYWYLNLTLKYLSNGSPLSEAMVTIREASGALSDRDVQAGVDGILLELRMRERTYNPDISITTPHTVTVSKDNMMDGFTITVDASMDFVFFMDNYPPVLVVDSPQDGSLLNVSTVTFEGEAWDTVVTTTEGLAMMRYRVDGGNWTAIDLPVVKAWSFDAVLDDGFHVVEIQVTDRIGNINTTSVTVELDTEPPGLVILSPDDGIHINYTQVTVEGVTDQGSNVTVDGVDVLVDSVGMFNRTLTLVDGTNIIEVVATDPKGNKITVTVTVTVDTELPVVLLDQDNFITNDNTFTLSGTKKADASLYINGHLPQFFGSTTFDTEVDLAVEGLNAVDIWSEDLAGNNWSMSIIIELDTTPPDLLVGQLSEYTNKVTVTVQGSTDDPDTVLTINGETVTLTGLTFAKVLTLTEGMNTITVEAEDLLGNAAEPVVQTITLSTTPPPLTMITPKKIETLEDMYQLDGQTDTGLPVSVQVILGAYSKIYHLVAGDDGTFSLSVALPQVGNHSVTATVTNEAGNQASEEVFFVRNRQDPPKPPGPEETSWIEDNWAYVILIASAIASAGVVMMTLSAGKRRREQQAKERAARAAQAAEEEQEDWEEEPEEEPPVGEASEEAEEEDRDEAPEDEEPKDEGE
jgi:hypothetical protein